MRSMYPLFCTFRNPKSYKIRGTLQNKGLQNKGYRTVLRFCMSGSFTAKNPEFSEFSMTKNFKTFPEIYGKISCMLLIFTTLDR